MEFLEFGCKNFYSYRDVRIELKDLGLILIRGLNHDSEVAGSNGAGKTTVVVDLPLWVIWNRSPRYANLPGANVIHRQFREEGTVGWVAFEDGGNVYGISRYQGHPQEGNALYFNSMTGGDELPWTLEKIRAKAGASTKSDKDETQAAINKTIGLSYPITLTAMVMGKYSPNFASASDAVKKQTLEQVLEFDKLSAAERRARARVASLQAELDVITPNLSKLNSRLAELNQRLASNQRQEADWSSRREAEVARQALLLKERREELERHQTTVRLTTVELLQLTPSQEQAHCNTSQAEAYVASLEHPESILRAQSALAREEIRTLEHSSIPEVCHACGQPILPENVERAKEARDSRLAVLNETLSRQETELAAASDSLRRARELLGSWKIEKERLDQLSRELTTTRSSSESQGVALLSTIRTLELSRVDGEQNPFSLAVAQTQGDAAEAARQIAELEAKAAEQEDKKQYYEFWVRGFGKKGIQSYLLDGVIPYLDERCQVYTEIVFGGEAQIEFRTQKTAADGKTLREDFHVSCVNRFGADVYEGLSDGERERADICVALTLQDLVLSRQGRQLNFCVLDEVARHIDAEGVELYYKILELLARERSTVFVVTHSPALAVLFSHTWTAEKRNGISTLVRD